MIPKDMRPAEFPPKSVVEAGEKELGHPNALEGREWQVAYGAHFACGAALGAAYDVARDRLPQLPTPVAGMLFGLGVWAAGFQKLLPALGIQPKTTEQPIKKRPMPIMIHTVFGLATAVAYDKLH